MGMAAAKPVVLVVEDEVLIRMNAVEMIEDAGFRAIEAANADEASIFLSSRMRRKSASELSCTAWPVTRMRMPCAIGSISCVVPSTASSRGRATPASSS